MVSHCVVLIHSTHSGRGSAQPLWLSSSPSAFGVSLSGGSTSYLAIREDSSVSADWIPHSALCGFGVAVWLNAGSLYGPPVQHSVCYMGGVVDIRVNGVTVEAMIGPSEYGE